jgi:hypothetical protein
MKINRSVKCSLRFATKQKSDQMSQITADYNKVADFFIDHFWNNPTLDKRDLLKPIVNLPETWLSARFRKVAINIRERFLDGKYGSVYKPLIHNGEPKFS